MHKKPETDSRMLVQLSVEELRELIRAEVAAAEKPAKLLYNTKEAAAMLGVDESWLATKARAGLVPSRQMGHYRMFSLSDIEAIVSQSAANGKKEEDAP